MDTPEKLYAWMQYSTLEFQVFKIGDRRLQNMTPSGHALGVVSDAVFASKQASP